MGRKPIEQEVQDYLTRKGIDISLDEAGEIDIPDAEEMYEEFKRALYLQAKSGKLTGTGLVNGLNAVAKMVDAEARKAALEVEANRDDRDIEDILADAGLPRDRRIEIGRTEIDRLRKRTADLEMVVAQVLGGKA